VSDVVVVMVMVVVLKKEEKDSEEEEEDSEGVWRLYYIYLFRMATARLILAKQLKRDKLH
jgi:hypothetical protein